ncbi:unnamed protein product [Haemonchus placei]|uniref:Neur_chan_LBD domain-containing protein n=1 Tax=Haemonchus placei TaxID=6290 RepID=A0A0N4WN95_HAEPC|nr:unnamed protein product [Haemonchus placei]
MQYNLQVTFRQLWQDSRLAYQSSFPNDKVPKFIIITEKDLIWTPDTFFLNEKQAHRHEIDKLNLLLRIYANGSVMYSERLSLTLSCPMYLHVSFEFGSVDIVIPNSLSSPLLTFSNK